MHDFFIANRPLKMTLFFFVLQNRKRYSQSYSFSGGGDKSYLDDLDEGGDSDDEPIPDLE